MTTDAPLQTVPAPNEKRSRFVRIGAYVLAGGFGVTTLGAILLAQGQTSYEMAADFVHRSGMFSMLAGLGVLLFGYRWPVLKKLWRQIQESNMMQARESVEVEISAERKMSDAATHAPVNVPLLMFGVLVFVVLAVIACLLLFMTPLPFAALVAAWVNLLLSAMLTVTLVQCRGYVRTFCIGALFPAGFALLSIGSQIAPLLRMGPGGYGWNGGGGYGSNQDFGWRMMAFIHWGLIIVLGAMGVGLHLFLDAIRVSSGTRGDRTAR